MIRVVTTSAICAVAFQCASATTFVWMSAKAFLEQSDLIAIVEVSTVHVVTTPEGLRLQSAKAKIVKNIFRRFPDISETDSNSIVIYSLDPNAVITEENFGGDGFAFPIREGKAFVCLKQEGYNKFYPYGPLCFQSLDNSEEIMWPSEPVYRVGTSTYRS